MTSTVRRVSGAEPPDEVVPHPESVTVVPTAGTSPVAMAVTPALFRGKVSGGEGSRGGERGTHVLIDVVSLSTAMALSWV